MSDYIYLCTQLTSLRIYYFITINEQRVDWNKSLRRRF